MPVVSATSPNECRDPRALTRADRRTTSASSSGCAGCATPGGRVGEVPGPVGETRSVGVRHAPTLPPLRPTTPAPPHPPRRARGGPAGPVADPVPGRARTGVTRGCPLRGRGGPGSAEPGGTVGSRHDDERTTSARDGAVPAPVPVLVGTPPTTRRSLCAAGSRRSGRSRSGCPGPRGRRVAARWRRDRNARLRALRVRWLRADARGDRPRRDRSPQPARRTLGRRRALVPGRRRARCRARGRRRARRPVPRRPDGGPVGRCGGRRRGRRPAPVQPRLAVRGAAVGGARVARLRATAPAPSALATRDLRRARRRVGGVAPAALRAHGHLAVVARARERRGSAVPARDDPARARTGWSASACAAGSRRPSCCTSSATPP